MPDLDVNDLILDPEVAATGFQVLRRRETVTDQGRTSVNIATYAAFGSIVPSGDNSLIREEGYGIGAKTINVITNFWLRHQAQDGPGGYRYQPDIVVWNGNKYLVKAVNDYSQFGQGFVEAECSSMDMIDQTPSGNPAAEMNFEMPWNSDQVAILDQEK